jgi:5-methyltetrahydrofolate--homocysteine methyltransferase
MSDTIEQMQKDLYEGNADAVKAGVEKALAEGMSAPEILEQGLIGGMDVVGRDFKCGDLYIPEVLLCARAMHAGLDVLKPLLAESHGGTGRAALGKLVIGTVQGDMHDIGKNLVSMMLEGAGFEVTDLGIDTPPAKFVEAVRTKQPKIVGMAAMLTTTMPVMRTVIEALAEAGLRDKVKVIVGGAPVTSAFAKQIGADAFAPDAATAVDVARGLAA